MLVLEMMVGRGHGHGVDGKRQVVFPSSSGDLECYSVLKFCPS